MAGVAGVSLLACGYNSNVQPLAGGSPAGLYVDEFLKAESECPGAKGCGSRSPVGDYGVLLEEEPGIPILDDSCHSFWLQTPEGRSRILTVREADPGSGTSFYFSWSEDGHAVFIYGAHSGIDCSGPVTYDRLRIIYTLSEKVAWKLG